eukprot:63343_1
MSIQLEINVQEMLQIVHDINELQHHNNPRLLFKAINKLIPNKTNKLGINISKDENNIPYTTEKEKLNVWENYLRNKFTIKNDENTIAKQLLNEIIEEKEMKMGTETESNELETESNDYTLKELEKALTQRKNGKATNDDNICVDNCLKSGSKLFQAKNGYFFNLN